MEFRLQWTKGQRIPGTRIYRRWGITPTLFFIFFIFLLLFRTRQTDRHMMSGVSFASFPICIKYYLTNEDQTE